MPSYQWTRDNRVIGYTTEPEHTDIQAGDVFTPVRKYVRVQGWAPVCSCGGVRDEPTPPS